MRARSYSWHHAAVPTSRSKATARKGSSARPSARAVPAAAAKKSRATSPAARRAAAKPAAKPAARPASKPAAKPAARSASKPAAKPAARLASKPAAKPAARPGRARPSTVKSFAARPAAIPAPASAAPRKVPSRADFGKPTAGFFARQAPPLRAILEALRAHIEAAAPDATSALKWGMPFFEIGGTMMCALGAHKSHVNLILSGPPGTFADPQGLLAGDGKTGRHLRLTAADEIPHEAVRGWLHTAAARARAGA